MAKYDHDFIKHTLKYCKKHFTKNAVNNPAGFILKALENKFYEPKKRTIIEPTVQNEDDTVKPIDLDKELTGILEQLSTEKIESLKDEFLEHISQNQFFKLALDSYGFDHKIIKSQRLNFLKKAQ